MTEIGPELFPARKALTPGPWLPHFGHREFIERNLRIHPCAGIAIPVPDAARIGRRIDQQHVEPGVTQLVEQVDPAEACTADHGRSGERSVGKGSVSKCRERWSQYHKNKNNKKTHQITKQ